MGSRLLPLSLALGTTVADTTGAHGLAVLLLLLAIPCALAVVCIAVGDRAWGRTVLGSAALLLLLGGSAVRHAAPVGSHVPAVAVSAVIGAAILYVVPVLGWVLQPRRAYFEHFRSPERMAGIGRPASSA
jgi:predicted membrane channel-forming protein YqfA (hemolysin III family)